MHKHLAKILGLTMLAAVGAMTMSASAAQAKYLLLLGGLSVHELTLNMEMLSLYKKTESGLKIECSGGTATVTLKLVEEGKKITGSLSMKLTGCQWAGNKFCIVNDGGAGVIKASASGEVTMPKAGEYTLQMTSAAFSTIISEGELCTIPEKEVVSGTGILQILEADAHTLVKLGHLKNVSLKIGQSNVGQVSGEGHLRDLNPGSTFGISLTGL